MSKLKVMAIFSLIIIVVFSLLFIVNKNEKASTNNEEKRELSLKEAAQLGINKAIEWNKDAKLLEITSVDENMGGSRGEKGKRINWTLNFIVPGTEEHLLMGISNGTITEVRPLPGPNNVHPIKLGDIKYDSPMLLKKAIGKYKLKPGQDWATGYHFTLSVIDGKTTMTVVGIDKDMQFSKVYYDSKSGESTGAMHKVPLGGGILKVPSEIKEPITLKKDMAIKGIYSHVEIIVAWGDRKPREFNSTIDPFVEVSSNKGQTWVPININENIVKTWINSNSELFVVSSNNIFKVNHSTGVKEKVLELKTEIIEIDQTPSNYMAILSNNTVYKTNYNSMQWEKFNGPPATLISLQILENGEIFVLTEQGEVFKREGDKWIKFNLPQNIGNPSDIKIVGDNLVLIIEDTLWVYDFSANLWDSVKSTNKINRIIKKQDKLFGLSDDGNIYLIEKGGGAIGWIAAEIYKVKEKIITDLDLIHEDIFIATIPDYVWEDLKY